jgi:CheY-like chemotaxis protein
MNRVLDKTFSKVGRPFEVLVVEDEPADADLIRMALEDGPYACNVQLAINGVEALCFLKDGVAIGGTRPDLVLLDLNMPQMDGREVLRSIKADHDLATIPVVVLTTSDTEKDVMSCYGHRAGGFITKPTSVDDLVKVIHCVEEYWFSTVRRPTRY